MDIATFKVEEWMNEYEKFARYDIAQTCVNVLSLDELMSIANVSLADFIKDFSQKKLSYGCIKGLPDFRNGVSKLYEKITPVDIIPTIGAAGANHLLFYSIVKPDDAVLSILPTYQQLYSIPASYGARLSVLKLDHKNNFLPDIDELKNSINSDTKLVCINNPNNPTGALIDVDTLMQIVELAAKYDAYILCDEVYRGLGSATMPISIADIYEKGISVSSMSKIFSMPGLRLGWVATRDNYVLQECFKHREYNMISCSIFDESVAALALDYADEILMRNNLILSKNLEILNNWVEKEKHFSYIKPSAGTTALLYYDFNIPSREFCDIAAKKYGIFMTPGECFEMEYCVRIGFGQQSDIFISGLKKLSEFAAQL